MKKCLAVLLCSLLAVVPVCAAENGSEASYYVPPSQCNAMLEVMDFGYVNLFALLPNTTANFSFNAAGPSLSGLRIAVDVGNVMTGNPENAQPLITLLSATGAPEIDIAAPDSTAFTDGKATIKGTLTLNGITKPVTLEAVLNHGGKGAADSMLGLSFVTVFKRGDFDLADASARFGDTITLRLEMQAVRQ